MIAMLPTSVESGAQAMVETERQRGSELHQGEFLRIWVSAWWW